MQTTTRTPDLSGMAADWTLLECVAWIMFRDPRIVADCSPEAPRPGGSYLADLTLPLGQREFAEVASEPGCSLMRLGLRWEFQRVNGVAPLGPNVARAQADLLAKLRSGHLTATGTPHGAPSPQKMEPADWRGLVLREHSRGVLTAEPEGVAGRFWRDVTVPRDDILHIWGHEGRDGDERVPKAEIAAAADTGWWTAEQALAWLAFGVPKRWEDARRTAGAPDGASTLALLKQAQRQLSQAIASRRLPAWGQETAEYPKPPLRDTLLPIPAEDFAGPSALVVQVNGWAYPPIAAGRRYVGRWWQGITFEGADVLRAFAVAQPAAEAPAENFGADAARPPPLQRAAHRPSARRGVGGRPERADWPLFDQEMMRRLALDGGSLTLRAFKREMKDWAAQHMDPVPDDRTIERRIDARAPADVFVPE